ncbi:hypothetical protein ACI77O_12560 [Pseudomonas tritici]|uniref:hypothetical protein n=1 Tax=Pseudomonas tritici TaxID=2745518 RepID=UPI00387A9503
MTTNATTLPYIASNVQNAYVCPCCGNQESVESKQLDNYGGEVFAIEACLACGNKWKIEYRLFATSNMASGEVVTHKSEPLEALQELRNLSWLDEALLTTNTSQQRSYGLSTPWPLRLA